MTRRTPPGHLIDPNPAPRAQRVARRLARHKAMADRVAKEAPPEAPPSPPDATAVRIASLERALARCSDAYLQTTLRATIRQLRAAKP